MPRLSIVIPTKNEAHVLPRLLDSIRSQTFTDYELIVADAQSSDNTRNIAASYGARVVEGGMPGPGRNRGAAQASGEQLVFFDADIQLISARFLEDSLAEMERRKLDFATCKVKPLSRRPVDRALHEAYNVYVQMLEKINPHTAGFCIFVRRQVHESIYGFDETIVFCEDHDYAKRAHKAGYRFGLLRSSYIAVSVRRLDKDGRLAIALKFIYGELHLITKRSFKKMPFEYVMGGELTIAKPTKSDAINDSADLL